MSTIDDNLALVRRFWDDLYAHEFARLGAYFTVPEGRRAGRRAGQEGW
jgi:hypothetical protein